MTRLLWERRQWTGQGMMNKGGTRTNEKGLRQVCTVPRPDAVPCSSVEMEMEWKEGIGNGGGDRCSLSELDTKVTTNGSSSVVLSLFLDL